MARWPVVAGRGLGLLMLLAAVFALSGCNDDLYAACTISPDSSTLTQCVASGSTNQSSCVVEQQLQCDTRICGKYQGSDPFCTVKCVSDDDCSGGVCREFVFQSGARYCVELHNIQD